MTVITVPFQPATADWINLSFPSEVVWPTYAIKAWQGGDPRNALHNTKQIDLGSVTSIQTSKSLDDISGTWTITFKDARGVGNTIAPMDVFDIALSGANGKLQTVMRGVVDDVVDSGTADVTSSEEDSTVSGRCMAKYLQVTNTFLPVWDPRSLLPTSLIFGWGASMPGVVGLHTPRAIFGYLYSHFVVGQRNIVGDSGIPNARFWITYDAPRNAAGQRIGASRFEDIPGFNIPYIQFDETDMGSALKEFEVLGFTEAWVDEIGAVVYRQPQWDAGYTYFIPTTAIKSWSFDSGDDQLSTYVEVTPTGSPGISAPAAQASLTGRAPVPSAYAGAATTSLADPQFIIPTDSTGKVTAAGLNNYWYQRQRKFGMRTQQITSPLINLPQQAQKQAEGLLRFYDRFTKTAQITIPGDPRIRLGTNCRVKGEFRGRHIDRTYYINAVSHDYAEGDHYDTTLTLTHGRDPWDPKWQEIALPSATTDKAGTQNGAGVVQNTAFYSTGGPSIPSNAPQDVATLQSAALAIVNQNLPYVWGGGHNAAFAASGGPPAGYDCSGFVSAVLAADNLLSSPETSGGLMTWGQPGAGQWVTIYTNTLHVIIVINGQGYASLSTSAGGPQKIGQTSASTLDGLPAYARHPLGL